MSQENVELTRPRCLRGGDVPRLEVFALVEIPLLAAAAASRTSSFGSGVVAPQVWPTPLGPRRRGPLATKETLGLG
jgi:hypothetical protein